ncbi:hypothetical protein AMK59_3138 [Oryctes borbonicus]|uniref:Glycine rich protein n=1 Tax=Oryctes borbonicus TaxID=1629725 RepID=A0A0T6B7R8_9SCAR|nr:hypothetical protein AMK59_3138 [Oryctes borbonicus]
MNTLTVAIFVCLAVFAYAKPGGWAGHGAWGGWAGHGGVDAVIAPGVAVVGPAASAAGHGLGLGLGVGLGAGLGAAHGGVAVVGPGTVPAAIVGPAGKVVADGLYGIGPESFTYGAHAGYGAHGGYGAYGGYGAHGKW